MQDVTSLGGTWRLRENKARFKILIAIYHRHVSALTASEEEKTQIAVRLARASEVTRRLLNRADRILAPLRKPAKVNIAGNMPANPSLLPKTAALLSRAGGFDPNVITGIGIGAGVATSATSWSLIQIVGHASTGAAMAGLHGAAATSAGWAWFGGGSLATGGGGMALGHILLPGIGPVIFIGVSTVLAHNEAGKVADACKELESTNGKNQKALNLLTEQVKTHRQVERKLDEGNERLAQALKAASKRLRPLGFLSHLWRLLRKFFEGEFYTLEEFAYVQNLATVIDEFITSFSPQEEQSSLELSKHVL